MKKNIKALKSIKAMDMANLKNKNCNVLRTGKKQWFWFGGLYLIGLLIYSFVEFSLHYFNHWLITISS